MLPGLAPLRSLGCTIPMTATTELRPPVSGFEPERLADFIRDRALPGPSGAVHATRLAPVQSTLLAFPERRAKNLAETQPYRTPENDESPHRPSLDATTERSRRSSGIRSARPWKKWRVASLTFVQEKSCLTPNPHETIYKDVGPQPRASR